MLNDVAFEEGISITSACQKASHSNVIRFLNVQRKVNV